MLHWFTWNLKFVSNILFIIIKSFLVTSIFSSHLLFEKKIHSSRLVLQLCRNQFCRISDYMLWVISFFLQWFHPWVVLFYLELGLMRKSSSCPKYIIKISFNSFAQYWNGALVNPLSVSPTKWSNTLKKFVCEQATNWLSLFDYFACGCYFLPPRNLEKVAGCVWF